MSSTTYKVCSKCGAHLIRRENVMTTSYPSQYIYDCPECGNVEYDIHMYPCGDDACHLVLSETVDYKKLYEEALERARALHDEAIDKGYVIDYVKDYETIFPELAESEDERIRKFLIDRLSCGIWKEEWPFSPPECVEYLEKQKDSIPYAKYVEDIAAIHAEARTKYHAGWNDGYEAKQKEQKENPKNAISIPADCASNAKCPYKINGDEDFIGDIKDTPAYHFGFDEGFRSEREKQKPIDYDHEMWKNCEANFEGGKKEVIEHPEKYGLQKEQKPAEPSIDELQRREEEFYNFKIFAAKQAKEHHISFVHDFEWNNFCAELLSYLNEKQKPESASASIMIPSCWEEKQKEQKPNIELIQRSWYMEGYHDREFGKEPKWIIKTGEGGPKHELNPRYGQHLVDEQKQEWSEEDEKMLEEIINHIYTTSIQRIPARPGSDIGKSWIKFLKSLRPQPKCLPGFDEMTPEEKMNHPLYLEGFDAGRDVGKVETEQPKQKWSEKDERMLNLLINRLNTVQLLTRTDSTSMNFSFFKEIGWLKSLRDRAIWYPSEQEMNELHGALIPGHDFDCDVLASLYADLKKLM